MRILLSAYVCEPAGGSEAGIGWSWAELLARDNDVTLLTDALFRPAVERARRHGSLERMRPVYIDVTAHRRRLYPVLDVLPHHRAWQRRALAVARALHAAQPFDVVHHVTYGSHRLPTELWRLDTPFIWGPVGGGESPHLRLLSPQVLGARLVCRELGRAGWNAACRIDPRLRRTATHAAAIGVSTAQTAAAYPPSARTVVMAKSALDRDELEQLSGQPLPAPPRTGLSLAVVGRLIGWKGMPFAFHAFAHYARQFPTAELHVYGHGPVRARLEALAGRLGIASAVTFHGRLPRAQLLEAYARHHVLVSTSLHDSHPYAVVEAMAAGLPVVCLATGSVDRLVPTAAGEKIRPRRPGKVIADLAAALAHFTTEPDSWQAASAAARAHAIDPATTPTIERMAETLYGAAGFESLTGSPTASAPSQETDPAT